MEHPIGALPRTPFPASRDFPSRGNEKIGGTGYCVTYDTESQSRNADFISIAAERQSATLGAKGPVKLKNPWARKGPSILRTFTPFRAWPNWNKLPYILVPACSNSFQLVPPLVPPDFSVTIGENRPMEQVEQDITYRDIQEKRGV